MSGELIMEHVLTFCGLVAAFSSVKLENNPLRLNPIRSMSSTAPTSPWKMNKAQLTAALVELEVVVRKEWTVPELRSTLLEQKELLGCTKHKPLGLSHLRLDQLKEKCIQEGLALPEKINRGLLMKMLRDNVAPSGEEMVPFGRYKNYKYNEVPENYLEWAMEEVKANENHSPDLGRLARWAQARRQARGTGSSAGDPESNAVIPPPHHRASPKKNQRVQRTRVIEEEPLSTDWSEVDNAATTEDQIKEMEERLKLMKSVHEQEKKVAEAKAAAATLEKGYPKQS